MVAKSVEGTSSLIKDFCRGEAMTRPIEIEYDFDSNTSRVFKKIDT